MKHRPFSFPSILVASLFSDFGRKESNLPDFKFTQYAEIKRRLPGRAGKNHQDRSKYSGADVRRLYKERGITGPRPSRAQEGAE